MVLKLVQLLQPLDLPCYVYFECLIPWVFQTNTGNFAAWKYGSK